MKRLLHIIVPILAAAAGASCVIDGADERSEAATRTLMEIEVLTHGADEHDLIHSVRFVVFDNASTSPETDVNRLITFDEAEHDAISFKTMLDVSPNNDKMVVAILNEPTRLSGVLSQIDTPDDLEDVIYRMSDAFDADSSVPVNSGIPMSGAVRGVSVTAANTIETNPATVSMTVERAVARVELWLRRDSELASAQVNYATMILLSQSYEEGYLATGTEADATRFQTGADAWRNFGKMLVPADDYTILGKIDLATTDLTTTAQPICAFYTPERTCTEPDEKIGLYILHLTTSEGEKSFSDIVLDTFTPEGGTSQTITEYRRNNIYRITGTVSSSSVAFDNTVLPWTAENVGVILDPQYFLHLTSDYIYLPAAGMNMTVNATTNYNRTDRGFPAGLRTGTIKYYDKAGNEVTNTASSLYGWLTAVPDGAEGAMDSNILFMVAGVIGNSDLGCYATYEIRAGNLTKLVYIYR